MSRDVADWAAKHAENCTATTPRVDSAGG
jgi:hypothetical protein